MQVSRRSDGQELIWGVASWSSRALVYSNKRVDCRVSKGGKSLGQVMDDYKAEVYRLAQNNLPTTRDTFIMPTDVYNLANKLTKELWEKNPSDAKTVKMWTDENPDSYYHYKSDEKIDVNDPFPLEDYPFCKALQTD
ncbi:hypothetical protein KC19_VG189000 [Ceratodon purpureus]|uniref:Uncharacterized protein n=1 Tax=Ceratodon purpureus TaxID=3225 RepID=A0A8T0HRV8_CERPU|nr:hypothetical protein KC19_VG189000 [Ceratodon purpureus]